MVWRVEEPDALAVTLPSDPADTRGLAASTSGDVFRSSAKGIELAPGVRRGSGHGGAGGHPSGHTSSARFIERGSGFSGDLAIHSNVLFGGADETTFRIWRLSSDEEPQVVGRAPVTPHASKIDALAVSRRRRPGGDIGLRRPARRLGRVRSAQDPVSRVRATRTGAGRMSLEFSPTDDILATGGYDGRIRLWRVSPDAAPELLGSTAAAQADGPRLRPRLHG